MDPALRQAVLGANNIVAPTSTLGASQAAELANMSLAGFQLPQSSGAASALAQQSQDTVKAQDDAAAAARANAKAAGAGKFKRVNKDDGGFAFVDPDGNEISAAEYARATGKSIDEVLKDSYNPIDKAFIQDYKQLNDYINNKLNAKNDSKARSRAQAVETQVRKLYGIKMHQQTPDEVINAFVAAYPTVFGGNKAGKQGMSTLLPTNNTLNGQKKKKVSGL